LKNRKFKIHKWLYYFDIYDRHFKKFIGKNPRILEIGVYHGGSLEMWNNYFDEKCTIYGIDINPNCLEIPQKLNKNNITIILGNQGDRQFWKEFIDKTEKFDIVIDESTCTNK